MSRRFVTTTVAGIKVIAGDFDKLPPELQEDNMTKSTTVGDYLENSQVKTMPIAEALDRFKEMPMFYELLLDLYEDDFDEVEMGLDDMGKMICRGVEKGNPTASQSHIPSTRRDYEDKPFIAKAEHAEQRYTLAPWYVPDVIDAHDEWVDRQEVQEAFWNYLAKPDRKIRLQHNTDIIAGRWVEGLTWPYPVTLPVKNPDGDRELTFPAGTPFLGVIWEPWAWEMVKKGEIRGLSIGGSGQRTQEDPDTTVVANYAGDAYFYDKMIVEEDDKFVVYDDDKSRSFGSYDTLEEATERLAQIEYFKAKGLSVGDTVSFSVPKPPAEPMIARGVITSIKDDGVITLPNTQESVEGTPDNPAAVVRVYIDEGDEWVESDRSVVKPFTELRDVEEFRKVEVSEKVKDTLRGKVKDHNESVTADSKKANLRMLVASYKRGIGAYRGNPSSVRPNVSSPQQWAMGRVNGLLHALKTGKFKRGKYDTDLLPAGHKLSTKKSFAKETYTPPQAVQEEAQRALRWMEEGKAGDNFTAVGRRRASQLGNGQPVSADTLRRMRSFLARHEDSSKGAEGFNRGDDGYPSAGRVSWAAWGGDAGKSWVESILDSLDDA